MSAERAGAPQYIRGVPHPLPAGETVLWEGAPETRAISSHVFHWQLFAGYFVVMIVIWIATTDLAIRSPEFLAGFLVRFGLSAIVLAIVSVLSRVVARTTWYAVTNRRIVLRIGMVFPMSINVPFSVLESAAVARFKDGTGQLRITLAKEHRIAYIALWPHCRVFDVTHPQPLLRGLPEPQRVGSLLADAVAAANAVNDLDTLDASRSARELMPT